MALASFEEGGGNLNPIGASPDRMAALALSALNKLNRAVAIMGHDGRQLFSNPCFGELIGEDDRLAELQDLLGGPKDWIVWTGPRELKLRSGRTFGIEVAPLCGALMISVEEISGRVAEKVPLGNRRVPMR